MEPDQHGEQARSQTEAEVEEIAGLLSAILTKMLAEIEGPEAAAAGEAGEALSLDEDFGALGLNSVDYLELVLNIEERFNVDIPDEALMDPAMRSIRAWAEYLQKNLKTLATRDVAAPAGG